MSRERERRRAETASELSQALGSTAELITQRIQAASTVASSIARPGHPAGQQPRRLRRAQRPRRMRGWLAPLLAAAAVTIIVVGSVFFTRPHPAQPHTTAGLPAFYLTINSAALHTAPPQVEVHRSSDGTVTGTLLSPSGWRIQAISAAASDRTFFVAEGSGSGTCPTDRFLEFSVTGTGTLTGPHQVGVRATGMIGSLAASPDGTRLAYTTVCSTLANPGPVWVVHVMHLASGAVSSWTSATAASGTANVAQAGNDALAWTADGRSLSFAYQWMPSQADFQDMAVVVVNTDSGSGTLQAHSRLIWHQGSHCAPGPCIFNAWISPDGTGLTAEALRGANAQNAMTVTLERLALPGARVTTVLFGTTVTGTGAGIPEPPAWGDSSGTYWLVYVGTHLGWVRQGQFHSLQPAGSSEAATW
jgi:hypothetical protein